jgi:hypothetical protein
MVLSAKTTNVKKDIDMTATAILTKYINPTNTRGARIKATSGSGHSITIPYPHHVSGTEACHAEAALALCKRMDWQFAPLIAGGLKDGFAFVFDSKYGTERYAHTDLSSGGFE